MCFFAFRKSCTEKSFFRLEKKKKRESERERERERAERERERESGERERGIAMAQVKLYTNKREREMVDYSADLFAILKTTEKLERAYVRDAIGAKQYETACTKLLAQFRTLCTALKGSVPDVTEFAREHNMECPAALNRLVSSGMPATIEHGKAGSTSGSGSGSSAVVVASTVQYFITAMDSLKLDMTATDEVYPLLSDIMQSLHKVSKLPPEFSGKVKLKHWLSLLHSMPASQRLSQEEVRQLLFDLESSYNDFISQLGM